MLHKSKLLFLIIMISLFTTTTNAEYKKLAYDFTFKDLDGSNINLNEYKNKIIVIVNVASQCGFTKQYKDMQKVWEEYQNKGVIIIAVPSNDFKQETGTNEEIKNFCESKFGITFPITEKVSVRGVNAHPFYLWAKDNFGNSAIPKWNFHKIIINKSGKVSATFSSITNPSSKKFLKIINNLL